MPCIESLSFRTALNVGSVASTTTTHSPKRRRRTAWTSAASWTCPPPRPPPPPSFRRRRLWRTPSPRRTWSTATAASPWSGPRATRSARRTSPPTRQASSSSSSRGRRTTSGSGDCWDGVLPTPSLALPHRAHPELFPGRRREVRGAPHGLDPERYTEVDGISGQGRHTNDVVLEVKHWDERMRTGTKMVNCAESALTHL